MIRKYTGSPPKILPDFSGVRYSNFWNKFETDFDDTNNISLVTFLNCGTWRFIIPGDLEVAGWKTLLENNAFQKELAHVNIFIASHHGRESGYCSDVFDICNPCVVVFSDSSMKHATQEMASTYASHASGITFKGEKRFVLSTRKDDSLTWEM